ncbi:uncharacterized protein LOC129049843 isoform X1 [Pongo abelii]|uniref:uncharacterized protein LOC129049843 isoform X1 n=1 Tax=Pongo abelii TaxID=9601 RepID=UPI0023E87672|nr:uncharacterized protein LOC129049843 isoform X1 [Pongo abelii]
MEGLGLRSPNPQPSETPAPPCPRLPCGNSTACGQSLPATEHLTPRHDTQRPASQDPPPPSLWASEPLSGPSGPVERWGGGWLCQPALEQFLQLPRCCRLKRSSHKHSQGTAHPRVGVRGAPSPTQWGNRLLNLPSQHLGSFQSTSPDHPGTSHKRCVPAAYAAGAEATRNKVSPPPAGEPSSPSPHYPGPPHRSVFRTQCFWSPWAELTAPALERSWQRLRKKTPFPVTPLSRRLSAAQSLAQPQGPCSPQHPHGTVLPGVALSQGEDPATVCDQQPKMGTNLFSALHCHRTIQEVGALSAHSPPPAGSHRVSE